MPGLISYLPSYKFTHFMSEVTETFLVLGTAIQSFCAPLCGYSNMEWDMISFLRSLKGVLRSSNAVAVVTFPPTLLSLSSSTRWQTPCCQLKQFQVPVILEGTTFTIKLQKGRYLVLECLNHVPIDGSSGS